MTAQGTRRRDDADVTMNGNITKLHCRLYENTPLI
jgi:hypothetical protein